MNRWIVRLLMAVIVFCAYILGRTFQANAQAPAPGANAHAQDAQRRLQELRDAIRGTKPLPSTNAQTPATPRTQRFGCASNFNEPVDILLNKYCDPNKNFTVTYYTGTTDMINGVTPSYLMICCVLK